MAPGAPELFKQHFALEGGRVVEVAAGLDAQQGHIPNEVVEVCVVELGSGVVATVGLGRATVGLGEHRGHHAHVVAERGGLDGFDIALSTTPGEPVADYARETATWAIHAWPALPDPDAVFEIVTTGPPA